MSKQLPDDKQCPIVINVDINELTKAQFTLTKTEVKVLIDSLSSAIGLDLKDELKVERQRNSELLKLLREMEWCSEGLPAFVHCPCCGGIWPEDKRAVETFGKNSEIYAIDHYDDCPLFTALMDE